MSSLLLIFIAKFNQLVSPARPRAEARAGPRRVHRGHEPRLIAFNEYVSEAGDEVTVVQIHPDATSMEAHMGIVRQTRREAYGCYAHAIESVVRGSGRSDQCDL